MSRSCPHCGAELPARAAFCRECGSDASTGWSDDAESSSIDLPDAMTDDAYEEFLARELPGYAPPKKVAAHRLRVAVVLLALAAFAIWVVVR